MRWRLKSPASRLFTQSFIRAQIKENIKAPRHWLLCGEFTGDRWIPRANGQLRGKCFRLMTSSWLLLSLINFNFACVNGLKHWGMKITLRKTFSNAFYSNNFYIVVQISPELATKGLIQFKFQSSSVHVMGAHRIYVKPSLESWITWLISSYMRH